MGLGSNYSMGIGYDQSMPVDPGYLGVPIYSQTSGALSSTQPSGSVSVNQPSSAAPLTNTPGAGGNAAAGMATGAQGAALPPQLGMPYTDYTQLPQYLKDFDVKNQPETGWMGQGPNPQLAANGVTDFNKLAGQYGNTAAMNPYFQTDAFKNDPRFTGTQVTNPFSTYDWNRSGFMSPNNGGPTSGYNYYTPGQGFNPISGTWAQGGDVYNSPKAANGHDTYWGANDIYKLSQQIQPQITGLQDYSSYQRYGNNRQNPNNSWYQDLFNQYRTGRGNSQVNNYYPNMQQNPGGY